ncbi:Uncharacterized protein AC507_1926 [Pseudomonas syringae pv. maculicola]|nr:Uncharacterized protein AC507_1926 [Pseudomonas syringae pv. maculicola]
MPKGLTKQLGENTHQAFKHIERLGCWLAMAGSTRTIFDMMGLEL